MTAGSVQESPLSCPGRQLLLPLPRLAGEVRQSAPLLHAFSRRIKLPGAVAPRGRRLGVRRNGHRLRDEAKPEARLVGSRLALIGQFVQAADLARDIGRGGNFGTA